MYSAFVKRINQVSADRRSRRLGELLERVGRGDLILTSSLLKVEFIGKTWGYRTPGEACEEKSPGLMRVEKAKII
jgi:hypothetical protein